MTYAAPFTTDVTAHLARARRDWSRMVRAFDADGAYGVDVYVQTSGCDLGRVIVALAATGDSAKLGEVLRAFSVVDGHFTRNEARINLLTHHARMDRACVRLLAAFCGVAGPHKLVRRKDGFAHWEPTGESWAA